MANYDIPDLTAGTVTRASMIEASILVNNAQKSRRTKKMEQEEIFCSIFHKRKV